MAEGRDVIWVGLWECDVCGRETVLNIIGAPGQRVSDRYREGFRGWAEQAHKAECSGKREVEPWDPGKKA